MDGQVIKNCQHLVGFRLSAFLIAILSKNRLKMSLMFLQYFHVPYSDTVYILSRRRKKKTSKK
jgi:hypothetical protein